MKALVFLLKEIGIQSLSPLPHLPFIFLPNLQMCCSLELCCVLLLPVAMEMSSFCPGQ